MNIAFDAIAILGPMSKNRGIGNYALAQFTTLLNNDNNNQYFFFNTMDAAFSFNTPEHTYKNLREHFFWCGKDNFLSLNPDYKPLFGALVRNFVRRHDIDVFYVTSPFDGSVFPYERAWFGNTRVVATVYDLIPYIMQDKYLSDKNTRRAYMRQFEALKHFDAFTAISNSVKEDMTEHAAIAPQKIHVIHGAPHERYKKITVPVHTRDSIAKKYGIRGKFILSTSGEDHRKNNEGLIKAYAALPGKLRRNYQLVLVCKLSAFGEQAYRDVARKHGVGREVVFTNFVTDDELLQLYNMADLMAFPSMYEGFGMPVAEAFACGVTVLTSRNSSLGEIAEGAAVLVNPFDIADITRGLAHALTNTDTAAHIKSGYGKLNVYNWENVGALTLQAIQGTAEKHAPPPASAQRAKLAFFTPLPPVRSGISDYSVDIIHALSNYFDIDVYIDKGISPTCELPPRVRVLPHRDYDKNAPRYHDTLYQMGNSLYHTYMYDYVQKYPGTVVLHDGNLHGAAYSHALHVVRSPELYSQYLSEDYDSNRAKEILAQAINNATHIGTTDAPLHGFIVNYAKKIIVHSRHVGEQLLRKDIGRNVRVIPSYAIIEPLLNTQAAKEAHGCGADSLIIASFGHIHETKRTLPALRAFARIAETVPEAKYIFVGKLDPAMEEPFHAFVKANALEGRVEATDYVDLTAFVSYMDMADICLNLRYPYNGETSATFMRLLAKGKCTVVNDIGAFGELPDDCCVKLPNAGTLSEEEETEAIYKALRRLIGHPGDRAAVGSAARAYAENNLDLNIVAKQYYDCIIRPNEPQALDEALLDAIIKHEVLPKHYTREEAKTLSRTLACTKECVI